MLPTLKSKQIVLVKRFNRDKIEKNSIVVVQNPKAPNKRRELMAKRLLGIEGDTVYFRRERITIPTNFIWV